MKNNFDKKKYDIEYAKENLERVSLKLNKTHDKEIIEKLGKVENKQGYIKFLIENDIYKKKCIETEKSSCKTRELDNRIIVIDVGYRKEQPIALVQKGKDKYMEYVVVFNYRIRDNKIDWAYGYYYDKDLKKAKEDFNKVLNNGHLANTFERKDELTMLSDKELDVWR